MKDNDIRALTEKHNILLIYLFGSQAEAGKKYLQGEDVMPDTFSDLDIAVAFEKPPLEAMMTYGILYKEFSKIFDPFAIDLIFMHEMNVLFQYEIIRGVRIYERNESSADEFEEMIMKRSEDLSFKKKIFDGEVMEAMKDGYFEFEYSPHP
ncbi:MAG: nucleotidyltransferase domain-containing protein [Nitrospirota bacterium]